MCSPTSVNSSELWLGCLQYLEEREKSGCCAHRAEIGQVVLECRCIRGGKGFVPSLDSWLGQNNNRLGGLELRNVLLRGLEIGQRDGLVCKDMQSNWNGAALSFGIGDLFLKT